MRTMTLAAVLAAAGCQPAPLVDAGTADAAELEEDGGFTIDSGAAPDAGSSDGGAPDASVLDAGRDAGADGGAADAGEPLPTCIGEGVWRNSTYWCEHLPNVIADYDCTRIFRGFAWDAGEWSGTVADVRATHFVLQYEGLSPFRDEMYACRRPPPEGSLRHTCEIPFARACSSAERSETYRGGVDYRPLCAAAQERGLALSYAHNSPGTGCRS